MKSVSAARFKDQCLALLDQVGPDRIIITKDGKPIAKLIPVYMDTANLIGSFKGKIKIKGNILSTGLKWMLNLDTLILLLVIKNGQFLTLPLSPPAPMEYAVAV